MWDRWARRISSEATSALASCDIYFSIDSDICISIAFNNIFSIDLITSPPSVITAYQRETTTETVTIII